MGGTVCQTPYTVICCPNLYIVKAVYCFVLYIRSHIVLVTSTLRCQVLIVVDNCCFNLNNIVHITR